MGFDRGDSHLDDAKTWNRACRHIALFLWWAVERGLGARQHPPGAIAKRPTKYFIEQCDTKLWDEDFTDEGVAFANAEYVKYLDKVSAYARTLDIGDYEIKENATTKDHFFALLDRRLSAWRKQQKPTKPKPKPR